MNNPREIKKVVGKKRGDVWGELWRLNQVAKSLRHGREPEPCHSIKKVVGRRRLA